MTIPDFSKWAKHLTNPYALGGFVILVFFTFIAVVLNMLGTISNSTLLIVISVSTIVVVFVVWRIFPNKGGAGIEGDNVTQQSKGRQSPNVVSGRDVNITYNDTDSSKSDKGK